VTPTPEARRVAAWNTVQECPHQQAQYHACLDCITTALTRAAQLAAQEAREEMIRRFRRWQDKFPDEIVPWQVIYVDDRPPTEAELLHAMEIAATLQATEDKPLDGFTPNLQR